MTMTIQEVTKLATSLMEEHGLNWPGWGFRVSRSKLHLGRCCWNRFGGGTIEFSKEYLGISRDEIVDTILHEIAHAKAGNQAGHGPEWKRICRQIGAKPDAKADLKEGKPAWKWTGVCPNNPKHTMQRHALTDRGRSMACGKCCNLFNDGKYDHKFLFEWHLTSDLEAAGPMGVKLITQPEVEAQVPTRISEIMAARRVL